VKNLQLKNLAAISVIFMVFAVSLSCVANIVSQGAGDKLIQSEQAMAGDAKHTGEQIEYKEQYEEEETVDEVEEPGLIGYFSVPKNHASADGYVLDDMFISRQICFSVNNSEKDFYKKSDIVFYVNTEENEEKEVVQDISIKHLKEREKTAIIITLDGVYDYRVTENENEYIIKLFDLQSVYDKIIVVDAGHGGGDNGCGSRDSICYEKMITLAVVKELKEKLDDTDIKVYYTRLEDKTVYLRPRVTLANDVKADMFISVHCNYYERYWLYEVRGTETLYSGVRKSIKKSNRKLAQIMLDSIADETTLAKRSIIDRETSIYILKKSKVPATIVEMGYMSDRKDLKYLLNEKKRKKIVNGLYKGIVKAYKEMYGKNVSEKLENDTPQNNTETGNIE